MRKLDTATAQCVQFIYNVMIEAVNEYARKMEAGEIPMRSGPDALRDYAATLEGEMLAVRTTQ